MPLVLINNAWELLRLILGCKINAGVGSKFCRMSLYIYMYIYNIYVCVCEGYVNKTRVLNVWLNEQSNISKY